jgi:dinuclear metal center YbgI/SA1388 family protein
LCTLDTTEAVVHEAKSKGCNLVVSHHPIVFSGLKRITGATYVERAIIAAIKHDIAIYACHTNLDNIKAGVNRKIAEKIGLKAESLSILAPKTQVLNQLYTYVPANAAEIVRQALFDVGCGAIGNYGECSFNSSGTGTFRPYEHANPAIGMAGGPREQVHETRIEVVFPGYLHQQVLQALRNAHPYEEVAYGIVRLENANQEVGSGLIGELPGALEETAFLSLLQQAFNLKVVRHTPLMYKSLRTIAVCGGAGSFLIKNAIAAGADAFVTADVKYHEFFDAEGKILLSDIGHYESEQYTIDLFAEYLADNFPTFAVLKSETVTNPVGYFIS